MRATTVRTAIRFSLQVLVFSALACGCGSTSQQSGADGSGGAAVAPAGVSDTLLSTVEDPTFGTYELVARNADQKSGTWNFAVRPSRTVSKNDLRFVWDFGSGPEGEGLEQTHIFTAGGTYVIKVEAHRPDNSIAFILTLTIEVVVDPNRAPVADAGPDQAVNENDLVFLFGGNSSDPDRDVITFAWTQTSGPAVQILHASEASASFVAPLVDVDTDLGFRLTVSDGELTGQDDSIVHVKPLVDPSGVILQVNAGPDQQAASGATVALSGSATPADPNTTFLWTQLSGPSVALVNANLAAASFAAPAVAAGATVELSFELAASLQDAIAADQVLVTVAGGTAPPDPCAVDSDQDGVRDCKAGCPTAGCDACPNDPRKGAPGICGCGVADTDTDGDGTPDCHDACPNDPEKITPGLCGCGVPETPGCSSGTTCVTSQTSWTNTAMAAQSGRFEVNFDATPSMTPMDGIVGISQNAAISFGGFAILVRFNPAGTIDARNGGSYAALSSVSYTGGERIHFRIVADVSTKSYDVYVTRAGGTEAALGLGYAFRTEQNTVTSLSNWGAWADVGVSLEVCGFAISSPALVANAGTDVTIAPGGSTQLSATVSGGAPTYTYRWSPSTGLSNVNIANPTATPAATTPYSLTVTDSLNSTANDTVTVTVQAASALAANAGLDQQIVTGGSVVLSGSASGGTAPYTYRWSPTTGLSNANIAGPTASPTATTTYTLTVTDSQARTATDSAIVTVTPVPTLVANAGLDQQIVTGGSVVLSGSASGGTAPYTYRWSPTTGLSNANIAGPTASPTATTTYTLTVTDSQARTATDSAIVTVTPVTAGNTYYVDTNAANASDSNAGTAAAPWKTLAKAGNTARAGDTVYVKAGTYNETLRPVNSGTAGNLITFKAYPGEECQGAFAQPKTPGSCKVIIDGQGSRANGVNLFPRSYVRVEGLEIRNSSDDGVLVQDYYDNVVQGIELVNNFIHHNGDVTAWTGNGAAIRARNVRNTLIENNELYYDGYPGIWNSGQFNSDTLTIRGNNIHHIGSDGIRGCPSNSVIEYNNIYDSFHTDLHQDGMDLAGSCNNLTIRYNTITDFTQMIYFALKDDPNTTVSNLSIYGNVLYTNRYWTVGGPNGPGEAPGIFMDARRDDSKIQGVNIFSNTFGWVGYSAVEIYGNAATPVSNIYLFDNIFYQSGIDISSTATNVNSNYNLFYVKSNAPSGPNGGSANAWSNEGSGSIRNQDPQFVNYDFFTNFDFHLRSTSPAINRGGLGPITPPSPFNDLDGASRPQGAAYDIGAYESSQ